MVHMMNTGHSSMAEWGFAHIKIQSEDVCLDIGCGGVASMQLLAAILSFAAGIVGHIRYKKARKD